MHLAAVPQICLAPLEEYWTAGDQDSIGRLLLTPSGRSKAPRSPGFTASIPIGLVRPRIEGRRDGSRPKHGGETVVMARPCTSFSASSQLITTFGEKRKKPGTKNARASGPMRVWTSDFIANVSRSTSIADRVDVLDDEIARVAAFPQEPKRRAKSTRPAPAGTWISSHPAGIPQVHVADVGEHRLKRARLAAVRHSSAKDRA